MRYTVGQKYIFVHQQAELGEDRKARRPFMYPMLFLPWQHKLKELRILVLTCAEHHKVPSEWDTECKLDHDGFIFHDANGDRWLNQYPRASYGQVTDTADGRVNFDWPSGTKLEDISWDDVKYFEYDHIERTLDSMLRGITSFKQEIANLKLPAKIDQKQYKPAEIAKMKREYLGLRDMLTQHMQMVISRVQAATGARIDIGPFSFVNTKTGERETFPDLLRADVVWPIEAQRQTVATVH